MPLHLDYFIMAHYIHYYRTSELEQLIAGLRVLYCLI